MDNSSKISGQDLSGLADLSYQQLASTDIFTLLGAANMPEEQKKQLEEQIMDTIRNRVAVRINDTLTNEEVEKWQTLTDDKNKEEFLAQKGIYPGKIMLEEALVYKMELVSLAKPIRDKLRQSNK